MSARPQDPAGPYVANPNPNADQRQAMINDITNLPQLLRTALAGLTGDQWEQKYRNWTIRQIVNHLADSHMNGYTRFKLALTENRPTIKPYDETGWSALPEAQTTDCLISLQLLEALHHRWVRLLNGISEKDFQRAYFHPEHNKEFTLGEALGIYSWHGRHHLAQIKIVRGQTG